MKKKLSITRAILLCMFLFAAGLSAWAQKDVLLYNSDITDWDAGSNTSSSQGINGTGAGTGFYYYAKPYIKPNDNSVGGKQGVLCSDNSSSYLTFPDFDFISGGVIEIEFYNNKNNTDALKMSGTGLSGITAAVVSQPAPVGSSPVSTTAAGASISTGKNYGENVVTFTFSAVGQRSARIDLKGKCGELEITNIKVYNTIGSAKYVASTNYSKAPANGYTMQGIEKGPANSGVPVNDLINIKGWNLQGSDIKLSIEGADASKFSFNDGANSVSTLTIPNAIALAGFNADMIQFTPSVKEGVANAVLKIEAVGGTGTCTPYYVSLSGITGVAGQKKILANGATIPFYTSLIAPVSQQFSFAGVDLTCPVTLSFSGTGSERFTVSETTVSAADAKAGRTVTITYTGDIEAIEQNVNLVLTSSCAEVVNSPLSIPLYAVTEDVTPEVRDVIFQVNPAGSAFLDLSLAGPTYKFGTSVNVKVYPETGWVIDGWSNSGTKSDNRTFIVSKTLPSPITVNLKPAAGICLTCGNVDGFVALTPVTAIGNGFTAVWTDPEDPTGLSGFDINIYKKDGSLLTTVNATAAERSKVIDLSAFLPTTISKEDELLFWYEVVAIGTVGPETTNKVGTVRLNKAVNFNCGQQ